MSDGLTARDIWPLVLKMPRDKRIVLARLALAASTDDAAANRAAEANEFGVDDPLAWEGEGWEPPFGSWP